LSADGPFLTLGIDPGKESGWAVALPDTVLASGMASKPEDRLGAIGVTLFEVRERGLPLVVVTEQWGAGGWQSHKALLGLGRAYGTWLDHIAVVLGVNEPDFVRVHPTEWRHHFFDHAEIKAAGKDGLKTLACTYAGVQDHNEAEAICLALYGQSSEKGQDAAEKAHRKASRRKRT
jgi:hypothetical protein